MNDTLFDLKDYMPELVYEYVPGVKQIGDKLNFRCPICGDGRKSTSHRGWFYISTGSYFCWNAGCPGNSGMSGLMFLSQVSGKSIAEVKSELFRRSNMFNGKALKKTTQPRAVVKPAPSLDKYTISSKLDSGEWTISLPDLAATYIRGRKLDKATFAPPWFKLYYDMKLRRIVIPWPDEYYQERTFLKSQKDESKYKFPPEVEKPIFGLDMLDESFKYIFVLEGVFDSLWVKNGVAAGSLKLSRHQESMLSKYRDSYKIVWMPDNQFADSASMEASRRLADSSPFESVFIWPKTLKRFKDVNESVIYSDKMIDVWKSEKFLVDNVANGLVAKMKLEN